jgi:hypothetical protein
LDTSSQQFVAQIRCGSVNYVAVIATNAEAFGSGNVEEQANFGIKYHFLHRFTVDSVATEILPAPGRATVPAPSPWSHPAHPRLLVSQ